MNKQRIGDIYSVECVSCGNKITVTGGDMFKGISIDCEMCGQRLHFDIVWETMEGKMSKDKVNGVWEVCPFHVEDNGEFEEPDPQVFFTANDIKNEVHETCPVCGAEIWHELKGINPELKLNRR